MINSEFRETIRAEILKEVRDDPGNTLFGMSLTAVRRIIKREPQMLEALHDAYVALCSNEFNVAELDTTIAKIEEVFRDHPNPNAVLEREDDMTEPPEAGAAIRNQEAAHSDIRNNEGVSAPRVYAASRASLPERPAMWRKLRNEGMNIVSSWIDEAGPGETADLSELWARIEQEVSSADVLVLYAESGDFPLKGAFIEIGIALGHGIPVAVVAPSCVFAAPSYRPIGSWIKHPLVSLHNSIQEALNNRAAHVSQASGSMLESDHEHLKLKYEQLEVVSQASERKLKAETKRADYNAEAAGANLLKLQAYERRIKELEAILESDALVSNARQERYETAARQLAEAREAQRIAEQDCKTWKGQCLRVEAALRRGESTRKALEDKV